MSNDPAPGAPTATRAQLLRRLATGSALAVAGLTGLPEAATAAPSPAQDVRILDLALRLERIQEGFYRRATASGLLTGELLDFARVVRGHETTHVAYLTAIGIHSVEARHAAWIRYLVGSTPAASALDRARNRDAVLATVARTGFIARPPSVTRRGDAPRYTG